MTATRTPFSDAPAWVHRCATDPELQVAGRDAAVTFAVRSDGARVVVTCDRGRFALGSGTPEFELAATPDAWARFFAPDPQPCHHHFLAMRMRVPGTLVEGDERAYAQHARIVHRVLALGRELLHGPPAPDPDPEIDRSRISERYVTAEVEGSPVDLHVATAGTGTPLLVLHTAGADSRQAHALMSDAALTARHEVIAFDLPATARPAGCRARSGRGR
ncbi:hypothetical protein [Pseudonocardia kunmingensis]|uniref:hypothetical protein n=1 Tax=Pseudonocardia kunmingensis TaxID=630975 RepID=UPI001478D8D0|nr:hypothetical protein [Pseudonocardia kunmingensis]